jgi:hypothetical protein
MMPYNWYDLYKKQRYVTQTRMAYNQAKNQNNLPLMQKRLGLIRPAQIGATQYLMNYNRIGRPGDPTSRALANSRNLVNLTKKRYEQFRNANQFGPATQYLKLLRQRQSALAKLQGFYNLANPAPVLSVGQRADRMAGQFTNLNQILGRLTPYDPEQALAQVQAKKTLDSALTTLTGQENQIGQDYALQNRSFQRQIPISQRALLSNYASRGMGYSTGYGQAVTNQQSDIANQQSMMDFQKQASLANIAAQRGAVNAGYQNTLSDALFSTVNKLSSRAGSLGISDKNLPVYLELAKRMLRSGRF